MSERRADLRLFYELMEELEQRCGGKRRLAECTGRMGWPRRGVYFFFEIGEVCEDGEDMRVVRVGTHALRPSKSTLWGRLSQHQGEHAGSMPGGGNHRSSIFRLHVGTALLATRDWPREIDRTWGIGGKASKTIREAEHPLEKAVSDYIGAMPFLWVGVDDPPGVDSDRGVIEKGAVALLSNHGRPAIDPPTTEWLGHHADREQVRRAGLWNVNHVADQHDAGFLPVLSRNVQEMHVTSSDRLVAPE